jgi:hypothetical protein
MMRREFLALLGGAAAALSVTVQFTMVRRPGAPY